MDETPSEIGARAERKVAFALEEAGWFVYLPMFAAHSRVDLIAVRDREVMRVQVKASRHHMGFVEFRTCSNTGNVRKDYVGDVDAFGVYDRQLDRVYLVPIEGLPSRMCTLRLGPPRNHQQKGIRYAADFEVRRRC